MPRSDDRPNRSRWLLLDERSPGGGRARAWLFLTHPGPSLLVTVLLVASAGLVAHRAPPPRTAILLTLAMLPAQLAIGALNDWADAQADVVAKPYKPIARGLVSRRAALLASLAGFAVSLASAATLGAGVLLADAVAVAAGAGYDLALKRTPAAVLAWWAGFAAVPVMAMLAVGRGSGAAPAVVPLAGLLAVALLLANGAPDAAGDARSGAHTLAGALGPGRSRAVESVSMLAAAAYIALWSAALGQGWGAILAAVLVAGGAVVALRATRLAFPVLAVVLAAATVSWLAALPAG